MITVKITGLNEIKAQLKTESSRIEKKIDDVLGLNTREMEKNAKRDTPVDQGLLKSGITTRKVSPLNWVLESNADYSPFMEFGTKSRVKVPSGLHEYAIQFKGWEREGGLLTAKQAIYDWCKRKGIPEDAWWPIYITIMVNGLKPRPFFFKQADRQAKILENDIKQVLVNEQRL